MSDELVLGSAALLSGVLAGFYFAYATVVSAQRAAADGADSMRRMNDAVERPPFLAIFLLAPVLAVVAVIGRIVTDGFDPRTAAAALGAVCVVAALVLTIAVNVPLNRRLTAGTVEWARFVRVWGAWNLARTWLCAAGAVGLAVAGV
ncbi:hypothetical protein GCM10027289_21930 [Tsukamurella serpentis]